MNGNDIVGIMGAAGILLTAFGAFLKARADAHKNASQTEGEADQLRFKLDEERTSLAMSTLRAANETIEIFKNRLQTSELQRAELEKRLNDCLDENQTLEARINQRTRPRRKDQPT